MTNYPDLEIAKEEKVSVEEKKSPQPVRYAPLDPFSSNNFAPASFRTAKTEKIEEVIEPVGSVTEEVHSQKQVISSQEVHERSSSISYADDAMEDTPFLIAEEEIEVLSSDAAEQIASLEDDVVSEINFAGNTDLVVEKKSEVESHIREAQLAVVNIQDCGIPVYSEQTTTKTARRFLMGAKRKERIQLENLVRSIRDHRVISVASALGASGASSLTLALASVFSEIRNEQSVAIDLVKEGNLGLLAGNNGNINSRWYKDVFELCQLEMWDYKHNVQTALYNNPELGYGNVAVSPSHDFRVSAHFGKPLRTEPLTAKEYEKIALMFNHFDAVFNDVGTDVTAPAVLGKNERGERIGLLACTTNFILVTKPNFTSVEAGLRKLATIKANGFSDLVRNSLVIINCTEKNNIAQIESTRAAFKSVVRAVEIMPFDKEFKRSSVVNPSALHNHTYQALLDVLVKLSY